MVLFRTGNIGSNYLWNAMEFLNDEFPNPQAMVNEIHEMNAHMIISIWSSWTCHKQYRQLDKVGHFTISVHGRNRVSPVGLNMDYPSGVRVWRFQPQSEIYWNHLNEGLFKLGMTNGGWIQQNPIIWF